MTRQTNLLGIAPAFGVVALTFDHRWWAIVGYVCVWVAFALAFVRDRGAVRR
jgi:hypothetical protein